MPDAGAGDGVPDGVPDGALDGKTDRSGPDLAREALARARADSAARRREHESSGAARRRAQIRTENLSKDRDATSGLAGGPPRAFGEAIEELLADRGWHAEATVAAVTANWADTVGDELAAHCLPVSLSGGVLTIEAESTAWATQIRLLQQQLRERVEAVAGVGVVRTVVVHGPTGPNWQHGRLRVRGRGPRDTYG